MNNKNEISLDELKIALVKMLKQFDKICRDNNIKYTFIGGSLIGAVRHHGIIPWDDDIDVALTPDEYDKLLSVIKKNRKVGDYVFMDNDYNSSYYYPFIKLVDTKSVVIEDRVKQINNYGIFIDIFRYNNVPKNFIMRKIYWYKLMFGIAMISGYATVEYKKKDKYFLVKKIGKIATMIFGLKRCISWFNKSTSKYNKKNTGFKMLSWPAYGLIKETQNADYFKDYIDCEFDGINAMICANYDKILTNTFGNYMELPPIEKRINHNMKAYKK